MSQRTARTACARPITFTTPNVVSLILYVALFAVLSFMLALAAGMFALFAFALRCIFTAIRGPRPTNSTP